MKLKELKCPNCNAKLNIKPIDTTGICPYCNSEFILDDEVIKVKHEHEIVDDTSLEIALTTLNKFKDYEKAESLFKLLLYKYAHKEEIYIGLIKSITHDFKEPVKTIFDLNEINDYWQKYTSLTTKTNIAKYSPSINELNKNFYLKRLNDETKELSLISLRVNINDTEIAWKKYLLFSEEKEHSKLESKYNKYLNDLKNYQTKRKKQIKYGLIILLVSIVVLFISGIIYSKTETPIQKNKTIKTSTLYKYCSPSLECTNKDFIKTYFFPTIGELSIEEAILNKKENTILIKTKLTSSKRNIEKEYTFNINDDSGPYIKETNCKFTDTEEIDLTKCYTLEDYTDGVIDSNKAKITNKNKLTKQGKYKITVEVKDKENNKETKEIPVEIIPTPITLTVNINKKSIQLNDTATISYEITPNVSNKEVTMTYDSSIISIENNIIKPLKIGETDLCITSVYDKNTSICEKIEVTPICQNSYTFNFDGSKKEKIYAGIDFCPGTYRVYAQVLNPQNVYYISYRQPNISGGSASITIAKFSDFLSDEGNQWSMNKGSYIETNPGITQITIVK